MKLTKLALLTCVIAGLSGCTSNDFKQIPYGCDSDESDPFCASVETIFEAAKEHPDRTINVLADDQTIKNKNKYNTVQAQPDFGNGHSGKNSETGVPPQEATFMGAAALEGRPIYVPEQVHRIFRGPWVDDYEVMHEGEHLFYKTPGRWTYGNLKRPGAASGLIEPISPGELGFTEGHEIKTNDANRVGRYTLPESTPKPMN